MLQTIRRRNAPITGFIVLSILAAACGDDAQTDPGTKGDGGAKDGGAIAADASGSSGFDASAGDDGSTDGGADGSVFVVPDTTPPTVVATDPASAAMNVSTAAAITVTFSKGMNTSTITDATFTLTQGGAAVLGTVTVFDTTATLIPSSPLALNTTYVATMTKAATDLAGNALAADYTWTFKTDTTAPLGPSAVFLGAAGEYVILAKAAISNVPISKITGNVALSPAAASYITGFSMTKAGTHWTAPQVVGSIFAADNDPPTPSNLTTAVGAMETAYTNAAGRPTPDFVDLGMAGAIGGLVLAPGLYKWNSAVTIPTDVTIAGAPNDVWIFQISGTLTMASATAMKLSGGARAKNIFWQVAKGVQLGTTSHAEGIVLTSTAVTLGTGASVNGRLYAQTAVTLAGNVVTAPSP